MTATSCWAWCLEIEGNAEVHMSPAEARALAAALVHYADEADQ